MSSSHKSDDYNLTQKSKSGKAGFELFKGEDSRYYFHFNDKTGAALLFSQAYKKSTERDVGVKSVMKNAVVKARYDFNSEGDKHYFVLRAGNKFAIGRSRFFKNKVEMEAHRLLLSDFFASESNEQEIAVEAASANTILTSKEPLKEAVSAFKKAENEGLQQRIKELENQVEQLEKSRIDISDVEKTEMPRQVFRIEIYKNDTSKRFHGKIIHPLSTDMRVFSGIDSQTIEEFMHEKIDLKIDLKVEKVIAPQTKVEGGKSAITNENITPNQVSRAVSEERNMPVIQVRKAVITARNPFNASGAIEQDSPFELTMKPKLDVGENLKVGEQYLMKIYVFSFATRDHFILLERNLTFDGNPQNLLKTRIHQNALPKGSHRLTLVISEPNPVVNPALKYFEGTTWNGETIIQVH
jgi:uncharacterized protein YegP (UPF0339 family)